MLQDVVRSHCTYNVSARSRSGECAGVHRIYLQFVSFSLLVDSLAKKVRLTVRRNDDRSKVWIRFYCQPMCLDKMNEFHVKLRRKKLLFAIRKLYSYSPLLSDTMAISQQNLLYDCLSFQFMQAKIFSNRKKKDRERNSFRSFFLGRKFSFSPNVLCTRYDK